MSDLIGSSGTRFSGKSRTGRERLNAIPAAIARGDEFQQRVRDAAGDAVRLADLMAEAIAMDREARELMHAGRDGRAVIDMEALQAAYALDASRAAYLKARGANHA